MPITYPRRCPSCGSHISNRSNFARHKKYCGKKTDPVQCSYCESTFTRPDDMKRHVRNHHSKEAERKAEESAELSRLELIHANQVPRLEEQTGGGVRTRSGESVTETPTVNPKEPETRKRKLDDEDDVDMSYLADDGADDFLKERARRLELNQDPMFRANLTFLPYQRKGLKGAVKKEQFSVTFNQLRQASDDENLGEGMSESLFQATRDTILQEKLPESTKVHLTLTSKEHSNGTVNSGFLSHLRYGIPVKEFVERGDYVHAMFESLANKMNSAQQMNPSIGFNATLTFITYPDKGGKGPASKNPNRIPFRLLHKKKDTVIQINNSDQLCCARALVTMKEYVDGDPDKQYRNLRDGRPIQERLAKQLHQDAGVPEGPCGIPELEKFQAFLGPQGYKITVVDYVSCACIFQGQVECYEKVIYLLKHNDHFNGLRSMIALLNRSYFCPDCCKGFNTDDAANHSYKGRNCHSCQRTMSQKNKGGCPDFVPGKKCSIHCTDCQRDFYGPDCFSAHKEQKGKKKASLCQALKKCLHCCKGFKVDPKKPHKCYHPKCRHCGKNVDIYNHRCFIQRVEDVEDEESNDDDDDDEEKQLPPLMVFADIECLI